MLASETPATEAISRVVSRAMPRSRNSSSAASRIAWRPPEGGRPRRFWGSADGALDISAKRIPTDRGSAGNCARPQCLRLTGLAADEVPLPDQQERQGCSGERDDRRDRHQVTERVHESCANGLGGKTPERDGRRLQRRRDVPVLTEEASSFACEASGPCCRCEITELCTWLASKLPSAATPVETPPDGTLC